jgi:diguanylate cyclase (GGDEF)-like protein/PAS domain S-box-containing protein
MRLLFVVLSVWVTMIVSHAQELEKVSLQLQWLDQFQFAGYYMAKEKGFYQAQGIELEILKFDAKLDTTEVVLNNKATYGIGRSKLLIDKVEGKKIVLLASIFQSSPSVLLASEQSGIKTIEDFVDKRIMMTDDVKTAASINAMVTQAGIKTDQIRQLEHTFEVQDLIDGKTDLMAAYLSNEPYVLRKKGIQYRVFDPKEYGFDFYSDILFTSEDEAKNHKQRALAFRQASIKGWEYAFNHIDETVDLIMRKYNVQHKSKAALVYEAEVLKELAYYKTKHLGEINLNKLQRIMDVYRVMGLVKYQEFDFKSMILECKASDLIELTREEKQWISEHPTLTYSEVDWKPLSIIEEGRMKGIMGDFLDLISARTGLTFRFVPSDSWSHVLQQFEEKKIDLIPGVSYSPREKEMGLLSEKYASYPMVIVTNEKYRFIENIEEFSGKTIAVPKDYTSYTYLSLHYPNIKLTVTRDIPEALKLVAQGKADAFVGHIATSLFNISELNLRDLKISGMTNFEFSHHCLVHEDDKVLLSIINKAVRSISQQEKQAINSKWVYAEADTQIDYSLAWKVLGVASLILLFLIYRQYTLKKHTDKLEEQEELYNLVFNTSLNGVLLMDLQSGLFLDCNDAIVKILKLSSKEEVLQHHPLEFSPEFQPDGRRSDEKAVETIKKAIKNGSLFFEWKHTRATGEEFWAEILLTKVTISGKEIMHVTWKDIDARKQAELALIEQKNYFDHQAHHDALTSLPNRVLFNDRLGHAIKKAERNSKELALFFIDLDRFKQINDSIGHDVGDMVLDVVAKRFTSVMRKEDTLARLGGDEFTVIIEDLSSGEEASILAEKLLASLVEPIHMGEHALYISGSIGISLYPKDDTAAHNLLKYADAAMYKAKEEGGDTYQFYSASMTENAYEHLVMEASLRTALKEDELVVYFQPQIDGRDDSILGMEALVRWMHPTEGMISPAKFIPLAEETGLIVALDRWVMRSAMMQVAQWYKKGLNPGVLSLNLSIKQLQNQSFIGTLKSLLQETGCQTQWLEFEVTESQIMKNPEQAIAILNEISDMGIELAIDDFGTGYSSLSYLKRLPIDKLKIDQSFISDIPTDEEDVGITMAVIALSQSLNLKVIAEGVETAQQRDFLVSNGCSSIQGYFYSRPIPADEMEKYLRIHKH